MPLAGLLISFHENFDIFLPTFFFFSAVLPVQVRLYLVDGLEAVGARIPPELHEHNDLRGGQPKSGKGFFQFSNICYKRQYIGRRWQFVVLFQWVLYQGCQ